MSQVFAVAKELVRLSLSGDEPDPLTHLRLQKLLYYAQAWSLVLRESELFPEVMEAWRHGPVVPVLYRSFSQQQAGALLHESHIIATAPDLSSEDAEFLKSLWKSYNPYSALRLSQMTHAEAPWQKAWGDRSRDGNGNTPIAMEDLEDFFSKESIPAPLAAFSHELQKREQLAERNLAEIPALDATNLKTAANAFSPGAKTLASRV